MLIIVNLAVGILAIAGVVWVISTGQLGSMDGNFLILVCLLLAAMFLGNFASSLHSGELKEILKGSKKKEHGGEGDSKI